MYRLGLPHSYWNPLPCLQLPRTGGEGGGGFCVFLSLPIWLFAGPARFPVRDECAGVEGVALRDLEDEGVVWGRVLFGLEWYWSGCEKGEILVSWNCCRCRNRDKLKANRRLRPYLDRRQRQKRAEAVVKWRLQCKLRTPAKLWWAKMKCKKQKQIPHEGKKHMSVWSRKMISAFMSGWE